jgi:hypothetical protein
MELVDLTLFHAVLEIRYAPAFLLWDRSGLLWNKLSVDFEGLRMLQAEPNQTVFRLGNDFEFAARIENASLSAFHPNRTLNRFGELAAKYFQLLSETLELAELSRVGCRLIFSKEYPTQEDASAALLGSKILRFPEGKNFNQGGEPIRPEWALRWESGGNGVHVRLRVDERKYDFEPPLVWEGPRPEKKTHVALTYDVDWYTCAPVLVTQISFEDWIKQCIHVVNRDSDAFLSAKK